MRVNFVLADMLAVGVQKRSFPKESREREKQREREPSVRQTTSLLHDEYERTFANDSRVDFSSFYALVPSFIFFVATEKTTGGRKLCL